MVIDGPSLSNHQISSSNPPSIMNMEFAGLSYGRAVFASIDTSCVTIVHVFVGTSISPPLCPTLFSMASRYGYYNDQIYFSLTAAIYHLMYASFSASSMAYLFGELEVLLGKSASTRHIINDYPLNRLIVKFKGQIIGMSVLMRGSTWYTWCTATWHPCRKNYMYR